jgi:hypothetical protein
VAQRLAQFVWCGDHERFEDVHGGSARGVGVLARYQQDA